jgi:HK97 family phage major capsid protein
MTATLATAKTQAEFEEMLNDDKFTAQLTDPDTLKAWTTGYARTFVQKERDFQEEVKRQVQETVGAYLAEAREQNVIPPVDLTPESVASGQYKLGAKVPSTPNAPGRKLEGIFDSSAEFLQAVYHQSETLPNRDVLAGKRDKARAIQNSFGSTIPSDGGFLIPDNLRNQLLSLALEGSVVRSRASVIPMDSLRVPIPTVDDTTHASSVFGGVIAYWTEESAALTESQATFGRVVLDAKKLTTLAHVPNELIADAYAFEAFIGRAFPEALRYFEDVAFISGSGAGEPLGFRNGSALVSVTRAGGGNDVDWVDIVGMYARMLPTSLDSAVWVCSPAVMTSLLQLTVSGATIPLWLTGGQAIDGAPMSILGRPLIVTEKVPTSGTAGDLNFVDFSQYLIGDRQSIQAMSSIHYRFNQDQTSYRLIERVDGRPWLSTALTPRNGGSTLSPYIQLS